jgi:serine/threonine-protein kinase HipA
MARRRQNTPLRVFLHDSEVGLLLKDPTGAISFKYDGAWLTREDAVPVSLSLPLRDDGLAEIRRPMDEAAWPHADS